MLLHHHHTICNGPALWGLYVVQHGQWFMSNAVPLSSTVKPQGGHKFYLPLLAFSPEDMTAIYESSIINLNIKRYSVSDKVKFQK